MCKWKWLSCFILCPVLFCLLFLSNLKCELFKSNMVSQEVCCYISRSPVPFCYHLLMFYIVHCSEILIRFCQWYLMQSDHASCPLLFSFFSWFSLLRLSSLECATVSIYQQFSLLSSHLSIIVIITKPPFIIIVCHCQP